MLTHASASDVYLLCIWCFLQDAGLKVKEYELIRKNFSDSGNFGEQQALTATAVKQQQQQPRSGNGGSSSDGSSGSWQQLPCCCCGLIAAAAGSLVMAWMMMHIAA
jgi:hypothetical protein